MIYRRSTVSTLRTTGWLLLVRVAFALLAAWIIEGTPLRVRGRRRPRPAGDA